MSRSSAPRRRLAAAVVLSAALVAQAGVAFAWDGNIVESSAHLVVGDPGALTAGDVLLRDELGDFGYSVSVVDDAAADGTSSSTALVVIAPSISSTVLGARYKDVGTPVVALSTTAWNDMALATSDGSFYDTTDLLVVDGTHPIAAGLSSTFKATNQLRPMRSVTEAGLPVGAEPVAVRSSVQSAHVVYTVSAGAVRSDGSAAPANRVVIGLSEPALTDLTVDGMTLLDNALYWADTTSAGYAVQAAVAGAVVKQGQWKLDDTSGSRVRDALDRNDGALSADTVVGRGRPPLALVGAGSFDFPGWRQGATIDADSSAVVIPNAAGFNPGGKAFRVELWVRPANSATASVLSSTDSPNIIQKGLAGATRQQWKIALKKNLTPVCVFKGDTGTALEEREARPNFFQLDPGNPYRLRCDLEAGQVTLRVYNGANRLISTSLSPQSGTPFTVANTDDVWLGKKPDATNAGDAYAGLIDNVTISKGA